jgi:hypothetical protein
LYDLYYNQITPGTDGVSVVDFGLVRQAHLQVKGIV